MPTINLRDALTPSPVGLASSNTLDESEGLTLRLTEHDALLELSVMLRTLEHERIAVSEKTALPSASALRLLSGKLPTGDFYPWVEKQDKWDQQIGPIKAFAWPMLLQAGGLAVRNGSRLALSPAGIKALTAKPAETLRTLWRKWVKTTVLDEFSRIDAIKGQTGTGRVMTAVAAQCWSNAVTRPLHKPLSTIRKRALCACAQVPKHWWCAQTCSTNFALAFTCWAWASCRSRSLQEKANQ